MHRDEEKRSEFIDRSEYRFLRYLRKQRRRAIEIPLCIEITVKRNGNLSWRKRNFDNSLK